jgi:hypothetical protein
MIYRSDKQKDNLSGMPGPNKRFAELDFDVTVGLMLLPQTDHIDRSRASGLVLFR